VKGLEGLSRVQHRACPFGSTRQQKPLGPAKHAAMRRLQEGAHGEMSEVQINKMHHAIKHELKAKFKERELMLEEKLKAAPLPASEGTEGGWIKAMFDTMDEDNDGMITVDQLKVSPTPGPWTGCQPPSHPLSPLSKLLRPSSLTTGPLNAHAGVRHVHAAARQLHRRLCEGR
jgi:hypothetical protein